MGRPLSGVRVLDLTRVLSGPHAGRTLADLGAEVIKVEPPDGDITRFTSPRVSGFSTYFIQQNVGKKNISIDLTRSGAAALLISLATHCDVLIENFRPGVMDKLGLDYDTLAAANPRLIYASISGYGQTGPWAQRRAYAATVAAEAGQTKRLGDASGNPASGDPHSHADVYSGMECAIAILAALFDRDRTGRGEQIDVAMASTMLYVNEFVHDQLWDRAVHPDWAPSFDTDHFPVVLTANGDRVAIASSPAPAGTFERFATAMGAEHLLSDVRFATPAQRNQNIDGLVAIVRDWARRMPDAASIEAAFDRVGIATGQLRSVRDLAESEWAHERGAIVSVPDRSGGKVRIPNSPWRFRHSDTSVSGEPRFRGEDNHGVLRDVLGMTEDAIRALESDRVLSARVPDGAGS